MNSRKPTKRFAITGSVAVMIGLIVLFIPARIGRGSAGRTTTLLEQAAQTKVQYTLVEPDDTVFTGLSATVNGKTYQLIDKSKKMCLQIVDQRDFDGNGTTDALVSHITACGGNCCPNRFFFVSALSGGRFVVSDEFAGSWSDPVIEKWKDRWSVVVTSSNEGMNRDRPVEITRRFILDAGKAVKVEEFQRKDMESILEMRSEIFDLDKQDETHKIEYHLDGDGRKDQITGTLWARWGRIMWSVQFAGGKKFSSNTACKRIGVLPTKTNGVNDLVCDQDTVLHWNGRGYGAK